MVNYVNSISTKTYLFSEHKVAFYSLIALMGLFIAGLLCAVFYGIEMDHWSRDNTGKNTRKYS